MQEDMTNLKIDKEQSEELKDSMKSEENESKNES